MTRIFFATFTLAASNKKALAGISDYQIIKQGNLLLRDLTIRYHKAGMYQAYLPTKTKGDIYE